MVSQLARRIATLAGACLLLPAAGIAQQPSASDTATQLVLKPARHVSFSTSEGTWMSLDVSPDGRTIVFDLLGDLYSLPITGGRATRLTGGMAWDCMPRYSPDGKQIAFISDRSGSDNLWVMNPDGAQLHRVTRETDFALSSPAWSPDGEYVIVRRFGPYPTPQNYLTNVPLWMYHKNVGTGFELYPRKANQRTTNSGAAFSPDGNTVYFSSHGGGYTTAELGRFQVTELDRRTGESRTITSGYGGGLRPIVSPDGHWLVYATRNDSHTALRIRDQRTLDERWLVPAMQRDDQEGYAPNDILPGYAFTPDSRAVIFTGEGKIKRVDVESRTVADVPFVAQVDQDLAPMLKHEKRIADGPLAVRELMWVNQSPNGRQVVFTGVGKIWIADLAGGTARRVTNGTLREYAPEFSPDGQMIAYVAQSDTGGARLMKVPLAGGAPIALTPRLGSYRSVTWSPAGDKLIYQGRRFAPPQCHGCGVPELAWISSDGGEAHRILMKGGDRPTVIRAHGEERVYYLETQTPTGPVEPFSASPPTGLVSVKLDGSDKRVHAILSNNVGQAGIAVAKPSPDGRWVAILDRDNAYVAELTDVGTALEINLAASVLPAKRITSEGANSVGWADGGKVVTWSFADEFSRAPLERIVGSTRPDDDRAEHFRIALTVPRETPHGSLVFRGARVVTMKGDEVIERGDILIEDNRIARVGPAGSVAIPKNARVIDAAGKTIVPGLVDVHAHPQTGWEMPADAESNIANHLAFGVTTTRNPSGNRMTFTWGELVDAGELVGPRLFGTAFPLTSNETPIASYEDALHAVRRYKNQGANSLKQYLQPRRIQRQWIRMAADSEGMNATNEGAADLKADLSMVLDGYTAFEHSLNVVPLYRDVVQLIGQSGTTYTPTLIVAYGGPEGELFWRDKTDMHGDEKIRRFTPHEEVDRKWRRHQVIVPEDFIFPQIARGVRDIVRAGGRAGLGSHGNQQGLGAQWELRMLQSGGLSSHEVLRVATIYGAESIGFGRDLGSLEGGKLADLLVLDANPLLDIANVAKIRYVVKNGVVYDGQTLDEIYPIGRKFPLFPWRVEDDAYEALPGSREKGHAPPSP